MRLQNFLNLEIKYGMDAISSDRELAHQIQVRLIDLDLLHSTSDGKFGPISAAALKKFQDLMECEEPGFLGPRTAEKLIQCKTMDIPRLLPRLGNDLGSRILKHMQARKYQIGTREKEYNIVYIEGMNEDGTLNNNVPNEFNDRRIVIEIVNGIPQIVGNWEATTEPGGRATFLPVLSKGAARIKFGQYKAWRVGVNGLKGAEPHEALIQVEPVSVHRDFNRDFKRTDDSIDTGLFGINQRHGFDFPKNDIFSNDSGSLVGRNRKEHKEFMKLIKQDSRFLANPKYVFITTIIRGNELVEIFPE